MIESALLVASHGYVLGAHMNERTLLNNLMQDIEFVCVWPLDLFEFCKFSTTCNFLL